MEDDSKLLSAVWDDLLDKYGGLNDLNSALLRGEAFIAPSAASALAASEPTAPRGFSYHTPDADRQRLLGWARRQLARFTYKPGWKFRVSLVPHTYAARGEVMVHAALKVEDTYHPGQTVEIGGWSKPMHLPGDEFPGARTDDEWFAFQLADHIQSLERHESQEWLRRDGQIWDDPHKNDPR